MWDIGHLLPLLCLEGAAGHSAGGGGDAGRVLRAVRWLSCRPAGAAPAIKRHEGTIERSFGSLKLSSGSSDMLKSGARERSWK
jgi:hypothetical protein